MSGMFNVAEWTPHPAGPVHLLRKLVYKYNSAFKLHENSGRW